MKTEQAFSGIMVLQAAYPNMTKLDDDTVSTSKSFLSIAEILVAADRARRRQDELNCARLAERHRLAAERRQAHKPMREALAVMLAAMSNKTVLLPVRVDDADRDHPKTDLRGPRSGDGRRP